MKLEIKVLAPRVQDDNQDFGDCFIINDNGKVVVYDCGSEELANQVLKYLEENKITKIDIVLSHNDSDHFNGIPILINANVVNSITTLLLLKYTKQIFEKIEDNDGRVTKQSLEKHIKEIYNNIYYLKGNKLFDALDNNNYLSDNIKIVGPSTDYFVDAVAKQFTPTEGDKIDNNSIMNALSVQLEVNFNNNKLLLTGDAAVAAFNDKILEYDIIQLPHHGNMEMAEEIFKINDDKKRNHVKYIVSDNKGKNVKGGSEKLKQKGHIIRNTKSGTIEIDESTFQIKTKGNLYSHEIYYTKK